MIRFRYCTQIARQYHHLIRGPKYSDAHVNTSYEFHHPKPEMEQGPSEDHAFHPNYPNDTITSLNNYLTREFLGKFEKKSLIIVANSLARLKYDFNDPLYTDVCLTVARQLSLVHMGYSVPEACLMMAGLAKLQIQWILLPVDIQSKILAHISPLILRMNGLEIAKVIYSLRQLKINWYADIPIDLKELIVERLKVVHLGRKACALLVTSLGGMGFNISLCEIDDEEFVSTLHNIISDGLLHQSHDHLVALDTCNLLTGMADMQITYSRHLSEKEREAVIQCVSSRFELLNADGITKVLTAVGSMGFKWLHFSVVSRAHFQRHFLSTHAAFISDQALREFVHALVSLEATHDLLLPELQTVLERHLTYRMKAMDHDTRVDIVRGLNQMKMPWHTLAGDIAIRVSVILGADNEVEKEEEVVKESAEEEVEEEMRSEVADIQWL